MLAKSSGARVEASRSSRGLETRAAERCDASSCHKICFKSSCHEWVVTSHQLDHLPLQQELHDCWASELKSSSHGKLEKTELSQPTHQQQHPLTLISHASEKPRESGLQAHLPVYVVGAFCWELFELQFSEIREQSVNYEPSVG